MRPGLACSVVGVWCVVALGCGQSSDNPSAGTAGAAGSSAGNAGTSAAAGSGSSGAGAAGMPSAGSGGSSAGGGGAAGEAGSAGVGGNAGAGGSGGGPVIDHNAPGVIVVIGSSTAAGTGPKDPKNAWVERYRAYLTQ